MGLLLGPFFYIFGPFLTRSDLNLEMGTFGSEAKLEIWVKTLARMVWVIYAVKIEVQHQLLLNLTYNFNGTYRVKIRHLSLIYTT